jgi:flagellar biosynthesis protein FlhG
MDTGPGTASNLLDIFLSAHRGILVTTPEPTSIENTHRFLRCLYLRRIKQVISEQEDSGLNDIMQRIFTGSGPSKARTLADVLNAMKEIDSNKWQLLTETLNRVGMSIIVNLTTRSEDSNLGPSMVQVWLDYFGLKVSYIGQIARDDTVSESVRTRRPLALSLRHRGAAWDIKKCVIKLLEDEKQMHPHLKTGL